MLSILLRARDRRRALAALGRAAIHAGGLGRRTDAEEARAGEAAAQVMVSSLRALDPEPADDPETGHLLFHARGSLYASIFAAPRLFQAGTPASIAVDLGCMYRATVEPDGSTRLSVESGQVSLERDGRRAGVLGGEPRDLELWKHELGWAW